MKRYGGKGVPLANQLAWTPNGRLIAVIADYDVTSAIQLLFSRDDFTMYLESGARRARAKVVDLAANKTLWSIDMEHRHGLLSSTASHCATWTDSDTGKGVDLWNVATGKARTFPATAAHAVTLSGAGTHLAYAADGNLMIWDVAQAEPLLKKAHAVPTCMAFGPANNELFVASVDAKPAFRDDMMLEHIVRYDVRTGAVKGQWKAALGAVCRLEVSADGKYLVAGTTRGEGCLWDLAGGAPKLLPSHAHEVLTLGFTPDQKRVYSSSTLTTQFLSIDRQRDDLTIRSLCLALPSPDGKWVAGLRASNGMIGAKRNHPFGAMQLLGTTAKIVYAGHSQDRIRHEFAKETMRSMSLLEDGRWFAFTDVEDQGIAALLQRFRIMDPLTGHVEALLDPKLRINDCQLHPSGKWAAVLRTPINTERHLQNNVLDLIDPKTGTLVRRVEHGLRSARLSPDGRRLVVVYKTGELRVWETDTWTVKQFDLGAKDFGGLWFGRCPDRCVVSRFKETRIVHLDTGATVQSWHGAEGPRDFFVLNAAGDALASPRGIWDVASGKLRVSFKQERERIAGADFTPDGTRLATGGGATGSGVIKIWDTDTGIEVLALQGFRSSDLRHLSFTPDGKRLVSWAAPYVDNRNGAPPGERLQPPLLPMR